MDLQTRIDGTRLEAVKLSCFSFAESIETLF
jgi:hypothetical protein